MKKLHPGARWHFRFRFYLILLLPLIFIGPAISFGLIIAGSYITIALGVPDLGPLIDTILVVFFFLLPLFFFILFSEIFARMSYNRWFYDFNNQGLRTERGIIWKKYVTVPYERIQNVEILRGIIARLFGFSSLQIFTAGYSASLRSEGYIPAVSIQEAEEIRNMLMDKIAKKGRN